jgi:hypothetical protein
MQSSVASRRAELSSEEYYQGFKHSKQRVMEVINTPTFLTVFKNETIIL